LLQTDLIEFLNLLVPSQISWKSNNPIRFESKWLVGVCYTIPYVISWNPHENRGSRTFHKCGNVARHVALAMEPILPEHSTVGTETSCGKYESLESKFFPDFSQLFEESRVEFSKIFENFCHSRKLRERALFSVFGLPHWSGLDYPLNPV